MSHFPVCRAVVVTQWRDDFEHMTDRQKRDWLGPEKYALWKSGKFAVHDFIPPFPDRAFTVKQLKDLDKAAFLSASSAEQPAPDVNPHGYMDISAPFSADEIVSIRRYTCGEDGIYGKINHHMQVRKAAPKDAYIDGLIANIKSAMTKSTLNNDLIVYRGIKNERLFSILNSGCKTINIHAFQSTSITREISSERYAGHEAGRSILMKIKVPKGTHCIDVSKISTSPQPEDEILLNPTGKYTITRVYYNKISKQLEVEASYVR